MGGGSFPLQFRCKIFGIKNDNFGRGGHFISSKKNSLKNCNIFSRKRGTRGQGGSKAIRKFPEIHQFLKRRASLRLGLDLGPPLKTTVHHKHQHHWQHRHHCHYHYHLHHRQQCQHCHRCRHHNHHSPSKSIYSVRIIH